jgi:hypothetical protein
MKKAEQDLLFVEIKEPSATRRDILMSSKDVLDALKLYEEYKAVKAEKQNALSQLKRVVDDLLVLNRKLRSKMPKAPIRIPDFTTREREETITGPAPELARPKSKLDVLQEELSKIEERLGALE